MSRWKTDGLRRIGRSVALLAIALLAFAAAAGAQGTQGQDGFVPVTDPAAIAKETLPASPLLYSAYALVWLVLIAYVFMLWRRVDRVERELRDVSTRLASGKR